MNKEMCVKLVVSLTVIVLITLLGMKLMKKVDKKEHFEGCPYKNVHPDVVAKDYITENEKKMEEQDDEESKLDKILETLDKNKKHDNNYVKKTAVELAAKSAAHQYCPVDPDFDITQYVKKTEVNEMVKCPKVPDMKDFVLKTIFLRK